MNMTQENRTSHRKHRRRIPKSCRQCRERKVRCDRGLPCRPCRRSRSALQCSYEGEKPATPGQVDPPEHHEHECIDPDGDIPTLETQTQTQTGSNPGAPHLASGAGTESLSQRPGVPDRVGVSDNSSSTLTQPNYQSIDELQRRISRLEQQLDSVNHEKVTPCSLGLSVPLPRPHLRVESAKTRLFGQSHWMHTLEQFQTLAGLQAQPYFDIDEYKAHRAEMAPMINEAVNTRASVKIKQTSKLREVMPDLLNTVPPREICDQAIECYLRTLEQIFRILHIPSFKREYENFWSSSHSSTAGFVLKLVLVVAIGSVFLTDRSQSNEIRDLARGWAYAAQWWITGPTEREAMNLDGIQVFCLLILAREVNSLGGAASVATESLLKLAFTVGLHLDPGTFRPMPRIQAELRRRLWIAVVEITVITSQDSTLPLSPLVGSFKPKSPTNILDEDLDAEHPQAGDFGEQGIRTDCSLQLLLMKSLPLRIEVVQQLNNIHDERSYERTLKFSSALTAHCREIATYFDEETGYFDSGMFHRKFLDTYTRRLILFLHRPFCLHARKDPRFFLARKICLESSLIMISSTENMNLPFGPLDDFDRMCIRGSGLFKGGLSSDALPAIGAEIISQIQEETGFRAPNSTAIATSDPLVRLSQMNREPLMRKLEHVHEQMSQIIALGRPSIKRHIFMSAVLAQIKAMEAGEDLKLRVFEALKDSLRKCVHMLREAGSSTGALTPAMTDGSDPFSLDAMDWCGFDFSLSDPNFDIDLQGVLASPTLVGTDNVL